MCTMTDVRYAILNDAPELSSLVQQTIRISNGQDYPKRVIDRVTDNFSLQNVCQLINSRTVWVAVRGGTLSGTASLDGNTVRMVFVLPSAQGKGIGQCLMQTVEKTARSRGHKVLRVPASLTARGFYSKLGYFDVRELLYGDERTFVMEKSLS